MEREEDKETKRLSKEYDRDDRLLFTKITGLF
jgi:hypothetical protein